MKSRWMAASALALVVMIGATEANARGPDGPSGPGTSREELLGRGETIAEALCSSCHATDRTADSPHPEAIPFSQLSWKYPVRSLAEPLAEGIMVGHPDMPEWQFEPPDIEALLAYLESIQRPQQT